MAFAVRRAGSSRVQQDGLMINELGLFSFGRLACNANVVVENHMLFLKRMRGI